MKNFYVCVKTGGNFHYCLEDGEFIGDFSSALEATEELRNRLVGCLKSEQQYIMYLEDEISSLCWNIKDILSDEEIPNPKKLTNIRELLES